MRRISPGAWAAVAAALATTVACLVALSRLSSLPPAAAHFDRAPGERLLTVQTDRDLILVEKEAAWRLDESLQLEQIQKYPPLASVISVAWHENTLRLVGLHKADGRGVLVEIHGLRARTIYPTRVFAVHADLDYDAPSVPDNVPLEALRGVVWQNGEPLFLVSERGAEWLVARDGTVRKMPEGALSVWSATYLHPPIANASRIPFVDEDGSALAILPHGAPAFSVQLGRLAPLEPSQTTHLHRRLWLGDTAFAASLERSPFDFYRFGGGDISLARNGREAAFVLTQTAPAVAALTGAPSLVWTLACALLSLAAAALLVAASRARRRLRETPSQVLIGTLQIPPGAVLHTDGRGKVALSGNVSLRTARGSFALESGPRRDDPAGAPLVDGDAVYLVGRVDDSGDGGPWRSSGRARIVPDENEQFLLGRGDAADHGLRLEARESARLLAFSLAHLLFALQLFGLIGLRPYL